MYVWGSMVGSNVASCILDYPLNYNLCPSYLAAPYMVSTCLVVMMCQAPLHFDCPISFKYILILK